MKALHQLILVILLAGAAVTFISIKGCSDRSQTVGTIKELQQIKHDTVTLYKDAQGREHGTKQVAVASIGELNIVYSELDSVKKVLKIKDKQIDYLSAVGSTTKGSITPEVREVIIHDKPATSFTYSDRWIKLDGVIGDTNVINYATYDSLIVTTYHKKKWLLGKSETFIDAYSLNPAAHISGLTGIKVASPKAKRWGIGPYAGYGFNGVSWTPSIGVSVQYSLFRF